MSIPIIQKLSIIIPCYNEKNTLMRCLEAVHNVSIPYHKEIIIIDDCSNDGTKEMLQTLESKKISPLTPPPPVIPLI